MVNEQNRTRKDKFEKRRKNTKLISLLFFMIVILFISLIGMWFFGGNNEENIAEEELDIQQNDEAVEVNKGNELAENIEESPEEKEAVDKDESSVRDDETTEEEEDKLNQDIQLTEVEPSDDNVIQAYEGNWEPIGTEQEGPHTVSFADNSVDRLEMREAILLATGLSENDYHEWWIANGGDQKVIATVSNNNQTEVFRVYLSWVDNEGWQPTKVELLKENDWEKYRSN